MMAVKMTEPVREQMSLPRSACAALWTTPTFPSELAQNKATAKKTEAAPQSEVYATASLNFDETLHATCEKPSKMPGFETPNASAAPSGEKKSNNRKKKEERSSLPQT